jgi:hypothetical protein
MHLCDEPAGISIVLPENLEERSEYIRASCELIKLSDAFMSDYLEEAF